MLPLLQRHHMVQPSVHLDRSPAATSQHDREFRFSGHFPTLSQCGVSPTSPVQRSQRAVPIRLSSTTSSTTYPPQYTATAGPSLPESSESLEHRLRRKTPNGTIDGGYDGSASQIGLGQPPLKHMIIPPTSSHGSSRFGSGSLVQRFGQRSLSPRGAHGPSLVSGFDYQKESLQSLDPFACDLQGNLGHNPYRKSSLPISPNHATTYNGTTEFLTYPATPALASRDAGTIPSPLDIPEKCITLGASPRTRRRTTYVSKDADSLPDLFSTSSYSARLEGSWMAARQQQLSPHHQRGKDYVDDSPVLVIRQPAPALNGLPVDAAGALDYMVENYDPVIRLRFREKALAYAHRAYLDLLTHLHYVSKRTAASNQSSCKLQIYPRVSRQLFMNRSALSHRTISGQRSDAYHDVRPASTYSRVATELTDISQASERQQPPLCAKHQDGSRLRPVDVTEFQLDANGYQTLSAYKTHYRAIHASKDRDGNWPVSGAKIALEMLTHLSEQSGWKWVDAMLLGGCLHHGLGHYEEALAWFSRIMNVDKSHVEAMSSMAAALYCLDRQDEAEQLWLRAIRVQPDYLDPAEHLVGLLYKRRPNEALEVIDHVQKALSTASTSADGSLKGQLSDIGNQPRAEHAAENGHTRSLPRSERSHVNETDTVGFASSGYALPGHENGRMLALVHAKGTMLYSLKDIDRASKAFEEAVLISTGRQIRSVHNLVVKIKQVLAQQKDHLPLPNSTTRATMQPLLLPPEMARHTAQLVFSGKGDLPGLRHVATGGPRRAAVQTTSNALLSLAKIFQDSMALGHGAPTLGQQPSGISDILALYYLSLSLQESPSTANNVGILLASVQQTLPRHPIDSASLPKQSAIPGIKPGSGLDLALAYYNYGLRLDPKHVHLHTNLGSLLKDIGQLDMAIKMYEQAVSCDGTFDIALTNLANAVKDRGRIGDAIAYYKRAVRSNPDFAEAVCGLATALNSVCDWRGRGGVYLEHGKLDRWHVDEKGMLYDAHTDRKSSGLMKRVTSIVARQLEDSASWGCGILQGATSRSLAQYITNSLPGGLPAGFDLLGELKKWEGRPWEGSRVVRLVERTTKAVMHRWYCDRYLRGFEARSGYHRPTLPQTLNIPSAPTVLPFHTFTCPLSARDIRQISQRNALRISCSTLRSPWLPVTVYQPPPPPMPHLNVGYVSSDFNNHPLAHLMQSVFGLHNRSTVKAFCYATTASDRSVHRQQIEREAPVFRDVSSWSSDMIIDQIVSDGIHVLVNLNGYTRGARNEIFAARPAPIQMSFMGFAGTLGAEWCDYILADATAIPPKTLRPWRSNGSIADVFRDDTEEDSGDWVYSENVVFCRDTFFCCDHAQSSDQEERQITWQEEQQRRWTMRKELFPSLPSDAVILGNFNQLYKIDPTTFRTWLRILANVPHAVLWLLRFPELGEANLRQTAKAWAGSDVAKRILFTDVAPKHQHISRARVCDLFLDTPECNAHTTSADVLWSSTPLLTLPRYQYKMCSRMAASILQGALPRNEEGLRVAKELIAHDEADYEQTATTLARDLCYQVTPDGYYEGHGRLAVIRKLLFDNKWNCALFDTRRWVRDIEQAYQEAWRQWLEGEQGDIYL